MTIFSKHKTPEEKEKEEKAKFPISKEVAREQLDLFFEHFEIDFDDVEDAEKKAGIKQINDKLIKFIRRGRLEIKESIIDGKNKFTVIQKLKHGKDKAGNPTEISYGTIKGKSKLSMGSKLDRDYHGRMYGLMANISDVPEDWLHDLEDVDISLVECLGALFLSV